MLGLPDFQIVPSAAHGQGRDHHQNHGAGTVLLRLFRLRVGIRVHSGGLAGTVHHGQDADGTIGVDLAGGALVLAGADRLRVGDSGHVVALRFFILLRQGQQIGLRDGVEEIDVLAIPLFVDYQIKGIVAGGGEGEKFLAVLVRHIVHHCALPVRGQRGGQTGCSVRLLLGVRAGGSGCFKRCGRGLCGSIGFRLIGAGGLIRFPSIALDCGVIHHHIGHENMCTLGKAVHVAHLFIDTAVVSCDADGNGAIICNGDAPGVAVLPPFQIAGHILPLTIQANLDFGAGKSVSSSICDAVAHIRASAGTVGGLGNLYFDAGRLHLCGIGRAHHGKCRPQAQKHAQQQSYHAPQGFCFHRLNSPFQNWLWTAHLPPGSYPARPAGPPARRSCRAPPG